jgi:hypothetical protein
VTVDGDVGVDALHDFVKRASLRLIERHVVAVEIRAGSVDARPRLGAVRVHHRHDPEVDVRGEKLRLRCNVADQV